VADASHELRSPLTAIRTGLEVGLSHPDRAPWPEIAGRAVRQSQRLEQLIAELLVLAKADALRLAARRQPVDLAALLADLAAATPAPGVSIDLSVAPGTATTGNPEDLSRMFRNLLDNAIRYARHRVLITAAARPEGIVVEIADDGPGIPEEERERGSAGSSGWTPAGSRPAGQPGSGWPSPGRSRPRTAPPSCSPRPRAAEPALSSPWAARRAPQQKPRSVPDKNLIEKNGT